MFIVVAETMLKKHLLLDGATLTVRPKSSTASRHQTTRDRGSRKEDDATGQGNATDRPTKWQLQNEG